MKLKEPSERLDYGVDYADWLTPADHIVGSVWDITPAGLVSEDDTFDDTSTTTWLVGGTLGTEYSVVNTITTDAGRIEVRTLDVLVTVVNLEGFIESLANGGGAGSRMAAELPEGRLFEHASNANTELLGRLNRYTIADPPPQILRTLVNDLAAYPAELEWNGGKELGERHPVVLRYQRALGQLRDLANGVLVVPGVDAQVVGEATGEPAAYDPWPSTDLASEWLADTEGSRPGYWHGMSQGGW